MDKVVKISIVAGVLIVSLSIAYYLVIFLPKKEAMRIELQKQEKITDEQTMKEQKERELTKELEVKTAKCLEDAQKFHENYIKTVVGYYHEPKYNYNKKLGKCLYSGGFNKNDSLQFDDKNFDTKVKSAEYYWERFVKDVYTNETLVSSYNFQDLETITARDKEMEELMSN